MSPTPLRPTGDDEADALLTDPLAVLIGMLLDQQVPIEWAFASPRRLADRLADRGLAFNAATIAALDGDEFEAVFREVPALHRYPKAMAATDGGPVRGRRRRTRRRPDPDLVRRDRRR